MIKFIARMIKQAADSSLTEGKELYNKYFVNTSLYSKYKEGVDEILKTEGYDIIGDDEDGNCEQG